MKKLARKMPAALSIPLLLLGLLTLNVPRFGHNNRRPKQAPTPAPTAGADVRAQVSETAVDALDPPPIRW